jgi:uncharacterized RmlC-like cupin family protein
MLAPATEVGPPGPYTIALQVPPNTRIAAHRHRDERVAVVVSGPATVYIFGVGPTDTQYVDAAVDPRKR